MPSPRRFALISLSVLTATAMVRAQGPLLVPADLAALGYFQYWESSLDLDRARGLTGAHLLDDTLYFTTDSGEAHAMQAGAGLPRWSQNVAESVYEIFPPTHFRGPAGRPMVVFTTSARTLVIDRLMGDVIADMPIDRAVAGAGVITGSRLYFGSADGHLYCMNWTDPRTNSAVLIWRVMAGGPVTGRPLLVNNDDDLIFASQGGSVFCCTAAQKVLNWRARTGGPIIGEIALDGPGVFVAGTDRSLYRFNALSGTREWRLRFSRTAQPGTGGQRRDCLSVLRGRGYHRGGRGKTARSSGKSPTPSVFCVAGWMTRCLSAAAARSSRWLSPPARRSTG
jgi:outer membrane protein assembly factor BamB